MANKDDRVNKLPRQLNHRSSENNNKSVEISRQ